jgi:hypothetical protein
MLRDFDWKNPVDFTVAAGAALFALGIAIFVWF